MSEWPAHVGNSSRGRGGAAELLDLSTDARKAGVAHATRGEIRGPTHRAAPFLAADTSAVRDITLVKSVSSWWRRRPELNRGTRFCRPLHNHSGTSPLRPKYLIRRATLGNSRLLMSSSPGHPAPDAFAAARCLALRRSRDRARHRPCLGGPAPRGPELCGARLDRHSGPDFTRKRYGVTLCPDLRATADRQPRPRRALSARQLYRGSRRYEGTWRRGAVVAAAAAAGFAQSEGLLRCFSGVRSTTSAPDLGVAFVVKCHGAGLWGGDTFAMPVPKSCFQVGLFVDLRPVGDTARIPPRRPVHPQPTLHVWLEQWRRRDSGAFGPGQAAATYARLRLRGIAANHLKRMYAGRQGGGFSEVRKRGL